jgi:DnaJ-domain-containing protein 1
MILRFVPEIEESKFHLARNFTRAFGLNFSVMKRPILVAALLAVLLPAGGFAQGPQGNDFRRGRFSRLSMDEQARLRSAHDMAMRDAALAQLRERYEQARREYREKLRAALVKADPSVQPILEKVRKRKKDRDR